ncbi:MAG: hypothetical protein R6U96_18710 [Promethearchaeia archaeon]
MAQFTQAMGQMQGYQPTIDDFIRNTEQFEAETFGWPDNQEFPKDHYEFVPFTANGTVGIGKSTLVKRYFANVMDTIWGEGNVNFCEVYDVWAAIEQVSRSNKWIHFLVLDDAVDVLDSRQSMANAKMSQVIYKIRHELQDRATEEGSGHAGGLVFFAVLAQDQKAVDKRLREMCAFHIFKGYSKAAEEMIWDDNLVDLLKHMDDEAVRKHNYEWRKTAIAVDKDEMFTFFYADTRGLKNIQFVYAKADNMAAKQKQKLIDKILKIDNFVEWSRARQKGRLHKLLDDLKQLERKMYITDGCFTEVIYRAIDTLETQNEQEQTGERNRQTQPKEYLMEPNDNVSIINGNWEIPIKCPKCGNNQIYTPNSVDTLLKRPRTKCKKCKKKFDIEKRYIFKIKSMGNAQSSHTRNEIEMQNQGVIA